MILDTSKLINIKKTSRGFSCQCPVCAEQNSDSKGIHMFVFSNGKFSCVASPEHTKRIFELVGIKNGASGQNESTSASEKTEEPIKTPKYYDKSCLQRLFPKLDFYLDKGINRDTLKAFEAGFAMSAALNKRIVFPVYDEKDNLIGFSGRWFQDEPPANIPKWKHITPVTQRVYSLKLASESIKATRTVFLVESIGNSLRLHQNGIKNVLVTFGTTLSSKIINYLVANSIQKIYIALDNDEAGREGAAKMEKKLSCFFDKDKIRQIYPSKKDWFEMSDSEIKAYFNNLT